MNREILVPIRLTEEENELLEEMMQKEIPDAKERKISRSKFLRSKIFSASENEKSYKKILLVLHQIKTELHHAVLILNKTENNSEILEEIEKEIEVLMQLQEEVKAVHGSNSS